MRVTTLSPWTGRHARTTAGVFALAFLFAFEALAVAAVMPEIAADLHGLSWYAVAFAAPMAAAIVALVVAGPAIDRHGPGPALVVGLIVFCAGVVLAGLAPTMPTFLAGRLVHGLGGGVLGVALYVVVAQAYPESMRPRVFAVMTTAWVLPALVGPVIAASVAHAFGWRWVFLGVPAIAVAAWWLVRDAPASTSRRPRGVDVGRQPSGADADRLRLAEAGVAAAGVVMVSVGGQRGVVVWPLLVLVGLVAIGLAGRRLLPAGSWSARAGLPSVLGARGAVGAAFAAAEVYVPLQLTLARGLTLTEAGWVLTTGALTWCAGASLAARWRRLADEPVRVRLGAALVAVGVSGFALVAVPGVPLLVPVAAWGVAGLGIGMAFSTLSVLALAHAPAGGEARTSAALQLNDHLVQSAALAVGSAVFAAFASRDPVGGATLLILGAGALGVLAQVPAARLAPRHDPAPTLQPSI